MREIKFRAWDGLNMIGNVGTYRGIVSDELMCCRDAYDTIQHIPFKAVMQYTGLKDKNGVEIYEGDVLDVDNADQNESGEFISLMTDVFYQDGCFNIFRNYDESLLFTAIDQGCCVVGNIYENPELLEK